MTTTDEANLLATTDANVWAREFERRFLTDPIQRAKIDRGLMLSWFANAIETGRTAGQKLIAIPTEEDEEELNLRY